MTRTKPAGNKSKKQAKNGFIRTKMNGYPAGSSKTKNPGGRPKREIDFETVDKLCQLQCTGEEIASFIGVAYSTLAERVKADFGISFQEYISQKREGGKVSLRRAQWNTALNGNHSMLIWLGKQYLDQKEPTQKTEITGQDGGAIQYELSDKTIKAAYDLLYRRPD